MNISDADVALAGRRLMMMMKIFSDVTPMATAAASDYAEDVRQRLMK